MYGDELQIITYLVQLDGSLAELGGFVKGVPAKVNVVVTQVTREFTADKVTHDKDLEETNKGEKLELACVRDHFKTGVSVGNISELGSAQVDASRKTDTGFLDKETNNGKHGNTSVLDLNQTKAVELGLVTIGDESQRIPESKGKGGTDVSLEAVQGGRTGGVLGRSEGSGGGKGGGKDSELHG